HRSLAERGSPARRSQHGLLAHGDDGRPAPRARSRPGSRAGVADPAQVEAARHLPHPHPHPVDGAAGRGDRRLALGPRRQLRCSEPGADRPRDRRRGSGVPGPDQHGVVVDHRDHRLARASLRGDGARRRAAVDPGGAVRSRRGGRRGQVGLLATHHRAQPPPGPHRRGPGDRDPDLQQLRLRLADHRRRSRQRHRGARHRAVQRGVLRQRARRGRGDRAAHDGDHGDLHRDLPAPDLDPGEGVMAGTGPRGRDRTRAGRGRRSTESRQAKDLLFLIPFSLALLVIVFPVLWMLYSSLRPVQEISQGVTWQTLFSGLSLDSYARLFEETGFGRYLPNSILVCVVGTAITVAISVLAGFALSRFSFRAKPVVMLTLVATQLLPFVVLITPVYLFFAELRLLNSFAGLIIVYVAITTPLAVLLMTGFLNAVPCTLDEAARIDGASTLTVIARVIAPLIWPGIFTVAGTAFIAMGDEFLFAQIFLTSESLKTVQVGIAGLFGEYGTDWGVVMAASVLAALPTILLFSLLQRRLVAGMTAGAVKEGEWTTPAAPMW